MAYRCSDSRCIRFYWPCSIAVAIIMGFYWIKWILMSSSRLLFSMGRSGIMPTVFSKLHSKHKHHMSLLSSCAVSLIAPWLGRTALTWIVDMSSTGVSIAYFITCLSATKLFSFNKQSNTYAPVYKILVL